MAGELGSFWMQFSDTSDAYPTNGVGGAGSGSLSTASFLKDSAEWEVTGLVILTIGAADRTWTLKDAAGTTLQTFTISTSRLAGDSVPLGFRLSRAAGFTMESDNADCIGIIMFKNIRNDPTPS